MGLRRRLSKKWNETVNGVLSGPGVDVDSVNTGDVGNNNGKVILAGNKAGADADARLDAALADADDGDRIVLESAEYSAQRTTANTNAIPDKALTITGVGTRGGSTATVISGDWDFQRAQSTLSQARIRSTVTVAGFATVHNANVTGTLIATGGRTLFYGLGGGGFIEFQSGTNDGSVGVIAGSITVTDNGTNRVI